MSQLEKAQRLCVPIKATVSEIKSAKLPEDSVLRGLVDGSGLLRTLQDKAFVDDMLQAKSLLARLDMAPSAVETNDPAVQAFSKKMSAAEEAISRCLTPAMDVLTKLLHRDALVKDSVAGLLRDGEVLRNLFKLVKGLKAWRWALEPQFR